MTEEKIGTVAHYWPHAGAAEIRLEDAVIRIGDRVRIRGHGHDFVLTVERIEIDHRPQSAGQPWEHVAIAVSQPVHEKDDVLMVREGSPKE